MTLRDEPEARPTNRVEQWAGRRWDRRRRNLVPETEPVDIVRAIEIACSPEHLWSLVGPPEYAPLLSPGVLHGFTLPGTPRGAVGERQCFVRGNGDGTLQTQVIEITEFDPGHFATAAAVPDNGTRTTTTVSGSPSRSMLAVRFTATVPTGFASTASQRASAQFDAYLDRVRHHIESGWRPA